MTKAECRCFTPENGRLARGGAYLVFIVCQIAVAAQLYAELVTVLAYSQPDHAWALELLRLAIEDVSSGNKAHTNSLGKLCTH